MIKVGIPKGMRDFSPEVMAKRNFIFDTIKKHFQLFGFQQIETPAMENRETLTGKYGEEGDRLIFSVLNSGDYLSNTSINETTKSTSLTPLISDKALRYDLTVPFARYVVQHQNELTFPFKRYQIQPVWRADRPQKGRYREFYQCDADSIGSESLLHEVEFIQLFDLVLGELGLKDFTIKINNRKILTGIAELIEQPDKIIPITVAIDKLDKIGVKKVKEELLAKGLDQQVINKLQFLFELKGDNNLVLSKLREKLQVSKIALQGIEELEKILQFIEKVPLSTAKLSIDLTLARGLDYYTGAIFEVVSNQVKMGSICGGGRYADLTGIFGLANLSGVGISFGADRIYDVMEELSLFPKTLAESTELLFVNFGESEEIFALPLIKEARANGIRTELYSEADKLKKQFKYADQKQIPFVVIIGEEEMKTGLLSFKNMKEGTQEKLSMNQIIEKIKA
tara:strand:- start:433 stop:1794 length:1362 start_codon:yes stop_codon:yes gene_type:complete